ncbi:hypothetical protein Fmac_033066 [Flemingia macrophylla]|uniref:Uncharacterized protein n=1 Tax=Flemingia macrophylla TaxID=520843 RepID=A0ABD1L854_9FABA
MGQIHSQTAHCFFFPIQSTGKLFELLLHDPSVSASLLISSFQILQRELHSRNKKALEFIAKGWNALKEVDRVIDYCELNDKPLIPLLRTAKENFELALEADNSNTHARYWLSRLHMKYHVPGANKVV